MKVTLKTETLGIEILKAVSRNSKERAKAWNVKQAKKYLADAIKWQDKAIIAYAKKKLEEVENE